MRVAGSCLVVLLVACHRETVPPPQPAATAPAASNITITSAVPADVPGGADQADLPTAARFAWQQFIALNWPAQNAGAVRGQPDAQALFAVAPDVPRVWETFRSKVEIYPPGGSGTVTPHGYAQGAPGYGWNDAPQYPYVSPVAACGGTPGKTAWVNLDEISQVGFDHLYAGNAPGKFQEDKLVRFTAKANEAHYRYVAENQYWYASDPYKTVTSNFTKAVSSGQFTPGTAYVSFPSGSMEVKAAFRRLTLRERDSGRFHIVPVRFYEKNAAGQPCYKEEPWGLLALHIIQKTPTAPAYTWATFEQADNLRTEGDAPIEDENGAVIVPGLPPDTPALAYKDGVYKKDPTGPCVSVAGQPVPPCIPNPASVPYCKDPAARLYYTEILKNSKGEIAYDRIPVGGNICVTGRAHPIPGAVVGVNREAHAAIAGYEKQHGLKPSPWHFYKLVNVQAYPFDKSEIGGDAAKKATFYTANIVVETDYTLQHHSGGPETMSGGAPSDLPENFPAQATPPGHPPATTYQNAYVLNADGTLKKRYNMGGCTGCHGEAQVLAGTDYSYIMVMPAATEPETAGNGEKTLRGRYVGLLNDRR